MPGEESCVALEVGHVWYDTVDQPVIPAKVKNKCGSNVEVVLYIKTPSNETIYKSHQIKLRSNEEKVFEITISYYGYAEVTGEWRPENEILWKPLSSIKIKL